MKRGHVKIKALATIFGIFLIFLSLTPNSTYAELVGYWNFDENTGEIANDSSGFDNTGTVHGATWVPGKCGSALSFDAGSDGGYDYVEVTNSVSINTSTFTVSCWVSLSDLDRIHVILDKRNGQWDHNYYLEYRADASPPDLPLGDYLITSIGNGIQTTDWGNSAYASVDLVENQFYHIAATYDQSYLRLYLDGEEIASLAIVMTNNVGDENLHIGTHGIISMEPTYGIIDEVRIYNHALTQAEVADLMACHTDFNLWSFKIKKFKRLGWTTTSMFGTIDLPELTVGDGDTVEFRVTIELFGVLPGGGALIMSDEATLKVKDRKRILIIRK